MSKELSHDAQKPESSARLSFLRLFLQRALRLLASVRLAVPVLAVLILVLAAGTLVESEYGSEAAKILIYDTPWFTGLLLLLAVNVLGAALSRLPWQKRHTGFVLTHCGILIVLAGSFVTRHSMIDGQMAIAEGQRASALTLPESLIYLVPVHGGKEIAYPVPRKAKPWKGLEKIKADLSGGSSAPEMTLTAYYPKARSVESVVPANSGPAALEITLYNGFVHETRWLLEAPADQSILHLGPATLVLAKTLLKDLPQEAVTSPTLEFSAKGKPALSIAVPEPLNAAESLPLGETGYRVTVLQVYKDAVVAGRELQERPPSQGAPDPGLPPNAAIRLLLEGQGLREEHTVFAQFPEFATLHGKQESDTGYRIIYHVPNRAAMQDRHTLRLVPGEAGRVLYQIGTGETLKAGELGVGQEVETGWMGMKLRVERFLEHAALETEFRPQPNLSNARDVTAALEAEIFSAGKRRLLRLSQGEGEIFELGGVTYQAVFSQKILRVPFSLELKDFKIKHNPGTREPASFSSDVVLRDVSFGEDRPLTISMNQPLTHRGFKIYQSGYLQNPGEPEISIFAVARDPGIVVKYAGASVMVIGITVMFSMRRLYRAPAKKL